MKEFKITVNGNQYEIAISELENSKVVVEVNGTPYEVSLDKPLKTPTSIVKTPVVSQASVAPVSPTNPAATPPAPSVPINKPAAPIIGGSIKSPLPGVILDILIKEGDAVKTGQRLLVLEAMKMENSVLSDREGRIVAIRVGKGDTVLEGEDLVIIG